MTEKPKLLTEKPKLHASKQYHLFELLLFNRDPKKLKDLRGSMKTHGFIPAYPIHVVRGTNGTTLKIKAGHHRFTVARELGLPIYYVICDDLATVYELEKATTKWTMQDYLDAYCRCGMPAYLRVAQYVRETGIGLLAAVSMFRGESAGSGNAGPPFKNGLFQIVDEEHPSHVADIIAGCAEHGLVFAKHRFFVSAISKMVRVPEFDSKRFLKKIAVHNGLCKKQPHLDGYLEVIETVYNHASRDKVSLRFRCKEVMRERFEKHFRKSAK